MSTTTRLLAFVGGCLALFALARLSTNFFEGESP